MHVLVARLSLEKTFLEFVSSLCVKASVGFLYIDVLKYLVALVCYRQVMHRQLLRPGVVLGSFKLDVATVLSQQGHPC